MAGPQSQKRKAEEAIRRKPKMIKKFKKQTDYQSSSEDEAEPVSQDQDQDFTAINLQDSDEEELDTTYLVPENAPEDDEPAIGDLVDESEVTDGSNSDSEDEEDSDAQSNPNLTRKRKRNDPEAFATSMSKILSSKLSNAKKGDPVLSRSAAALSSSKEDTDQALERKAKSKMREERRLALEKGRVKDVLGASTAFDTANGRGEGVSLQEIMMEEKRHRKTAQRGVVHLFNAVRAAQVKGEQAAREARMKGVVGQGRREERVNEMSKKGFLELIAGGGKVIEEA